MGKVHIVVGDLLESDCTHIGHQANCRKVMGAGIAKQIANRYPEAQNADLADNASPEDRLGYYTSAYIKREDRFVYNLYGQLNYGRDKGTVYTNHSALRQAIDAMVYQVAYHSSPDERVKIGLPYGIGAGLANGHWDIIFQSIQQTAIGHDVDIYLYALVEPVDMKGVPYRVIVAGGRDFNDMSLMTEKLDNLLANRIAEGFDVIIVSGTARGADKLGEAYAELRGLKVEHFPAEWERYGKRAGYIRNREMAAAADALVTFYDGSSKGTTHMLDIAKKKQLPVRIVSY